MNIRWAKGECRERPAARVGWDAVCGMKTCPQASSGPPRAFRPRSGAGGLPGSSGRWRQGRFWAPLARPRPSRVSKCSPPRKAADRARLRTAFPEKRAGAGVPKGYSERNCQLPGRCPSGTKVGGAHPHTSSCLSPSYSLPRHGSHLEKDAGEWGGDSGAGGPRKNGSVTEWGQ